MTDSLILSLTPLQWLGLAGAYLLGSLSFAVLVSRVFGLADPRSYGSGNPGATNVLRSGNKAAALLTLLFDALKGYVPVLLARLYDASPGHDAWVIGLGLAAFVGHLWPVFFRFQGGKGVATAAGVILGLQPLLCAACLGVWLALVMVTRFVSLASITVAVAAPVLAWALGLPLAWVAGLALMGALLVWRHRPNIAKLLAGTESRIGQKAADAGQASTRASP